MLSLLTAIILLEWNNLTKRERKEYLIETVINIDNPNSIKLHEKAGFTLQDKFEYRQASRATTLSIT